MYWENRVLGDVLGEQDVRDVLGEQGVRDVLGEQGAGGMYWWLKGRK